MKIGLIVWFLRIHMDLALAYMVLIIQPLMTNYTSVTIISIESLILPLSKNFMSRNLHHITLLHSSPHKKILSPNSYYVITFTFKFNVNL